MTKKMVLTVYCILFAVWTGYADTTIVVHPNNKEIISSCFEEIHIWDMESGNKVQTFGLDYETPGYKIMAMAISPDGKRLIARYNSGIVMWDMEHFTACWSIQDGYAWHGVFSFSPDGTKLAYYSIADSEDGGAADGITGSIVILDVETGNEIITLSGHTKGVEIASFSSDGLSAVSSGAYGEPINLWNVKTGDKVLSLPEGRGGYRYTAFIRDNTRIVSHSPGAWTTETITIWDTNTGSKIKEIKIPGDNER
jgi:WD40 repeat protein